MLKRCFLIGARSRMAKRIGKIESQKKKRGRKPKPPPPPGHGEKLYHKTGYKEAAKDAVKTVAKELLRRRGGSSSKPNKRKTKSVEFLFADIEPDVKWEDYSIKDVEKIRAFVFEYLKDFSAYKSLLRLGYSQTSAAILGPKFLADSMTQRMLYDTGKALQEEAVINKAQILIGLKREANYFGMDGNAAARVKAWGLLGEFINAKGSTNNHQAETQNKNPSGVMLVPFVDDMDTWEKLAMESQQKLKESCRL